MTKKIKMIVILSLFIMGGAYVHHKGGISWMKDMLTQPEQVLCCVGFFRGEKEFDADHVVTKIDNGISIILNRHDRCVCRKIRLLGYWDESEKRVVDQLIRPGFRVVEVGANYGVYTLRMAELVGDQGKIYGFEANPTVSKYLIQSIKMNNLDNRITLFEKAAGDVPGKIFLNFNRQNIGGGTLTTTPTSSSVETEIVRLDDTIHEQHIDVLKMDVEGFEYKILKGALSLLERNKDHLILMLEFSKGLLEQQGTNVAEYVAFLKSYGFNLWRVGKKKDGEPPLVPMSYDDLLTIETADIVLSKKQLDVK